VSHEGYEDRDESTIVSKGDCPHCPSTSRPYKTYSDGHAHCFSCGKTDFPDGDYTPPAEPTKTNPELINHGEYRDLAKRGIRLETCRKFGYTVAEVSGKTVQVATYCDSSGSPVGQKVRGAGKEFYVTGSLKNAGLYGQHLWRSGGNKVIITEGEIDCLTVGQAQSLKWPTVSLPSGAQHAAKALAAQLEWLSSYKEIVLWFDNDGPGRDAVEACAKILPIGKVKVITTPLDCKDANELLQKHGEAAVVDALWTARSYRPDGVITGSDLTVERLKAKAAPGWQTPYPRVNALTGGVRPRQLWVLTAGTGVGKSTDAREWAYAALCEGKRVGMVFLEESVEDTGKYLVALDHSIPAEELEDNPDLLTNEQWERSVKKLFGDDKYQAYDHFGASDSDGLLAKLEFMAINGAELIFLDHLTIAATGLDNDGQDELLVKLRSLAERTGVSIIAIAHVRKEPGGHKTAEEGAQLSLSSIKGSGSLKQVPDVILAKERNQQADTPEERDTSLIRALKVRRGGKTGPADYLRYDPKTGRLTPCAKPVGDDGLDSPDGDDDAPF